MSEWFNKDYIVLNPDKSHYLTLRFKDPFRDFSLNNCPLFCSQNSIFSALVFVETYWPCCNFLL